MNLEDSQDIRYRVIERVGSTPDEYHWVETDTGSFTRMPREYGPDPTMEDAKAFSTRFNTEEREIQFWVNEEDIREDR